MDIKQELKYVINKHKDDKLKTFQTDIVAMAEACLREIEGLHANCSKLAEYEDSGLSPAEVQEIKRTLNDYHSVFVITEKNERYFRACDFQEKCVKDGFAITEIPAFIGFLKSLKNIGKTVFFTREEAEEQLKSLIINA